MEIFLDSLPTYFILMGFVTLYGMYIEGGTFMVALEKDEAGLVSLSYVWELCLYLYLFAFRSGT